MDDDEVITPAVVNVIVINKYSLFDCFLYYFAVPNPKPICIKETPIPQVTDLCLSLEKINLKELSACAKVSFKAKIGPLKPKKFKYEQCFKIPTVDGEYRENQKCSNYQKIL